MKKKRRKGTWVWWAIGVVCILLVLVLGVLFYVLNHTNNEMDEIQAAELAKQQEYTSLVTSVPVPDGWDATMVETLKNQAVSAYDTSFLTTINAAIQGDSDAVDEVLARKESSQPEIVSQYQTLLTGLSSYPQELVKLAVNDPSKLDLVLSYSGASSSASDSGKELSQDVAAAIPDLKTFDPAWAFMPYGNGLMVTDGSAPVAISMVLSHLFENKEMTPVFFAEFAQEHDFANDPVKEDTSLFAAVAWTYGVNMTPLTKTPTAVNDSISSGGTVIVNLGTPENNKFVVVKSLNEDGTWTIYDPTSAEESTTVDPETIRDQILGSYSYW